MTTPKPTPEGISMSAPRTLTRVTQLALFLNAVLHGAASVGMALGLGPHAAAEPHMGRRAAAAGVAGAFMLGFVGKRLRREPRLIVMPLVFVLCNLADTVYEFLSSRDPSNLAPALPETTFLLVYSFFAAALLRTSRAARSP
jgi:hypothetical protein